MRYLSAPSVGMEVTVRLGKLMDRAPRPYTARDLADLSGESIHTVRAFLEKNLVNDRIQSSTVSVYYPRHGYIDQLIYWRGRGELWTTFAEVGEMDDRTQERIISGERPVSWKDLRRTVWTVDELGEVATIRDRSMVRLGRLESADRTKDGISLRIDCGAEIRFRRDRK